MAWHRSCQLVYVISAARIMVSAIMRAYFLPFNLSCHSVLLSRQRLTSRIFLFESSRICRVFSTIDANNQHRNGQQQYNLARNIAACMSTPETPKPLPFELPPELADFLRTTDVACLMHATNQGTALVVKLPSPDILSIRGRVPMELRHELYYHPTAPVIRTVLTVYDQPETPLALETYTNIQDPDQRADFAALSAQDQLLLLFYNERLAHRLTKVLPLTEPEVVTAILADADFLLYRIPVESIDFDRAKRDVMEATEL